MTKIELIYKDLAIQHFIKKANQKQISPYIQSLYQACGQRFNGSLEEFAAYVANYNANQSGIGQISQLRILRKKYPNIIELPSGGTNSFVLSKCNRNYSITKGGTATNDTKTFDAMVALRNKYLFFVLKTVDLSPFSSTTDGGHQTNVKNELKNLIHVCNRIPKLTYNKKPVIIHILIDGRSAPKIIEDCIDICDNDELLEINSCAHL